MKEFQLGKHKVSIYNSIDELPMARFHKYNKMLLVDAGLGSDLNAVDGHIERAVRYIKNDQRNEAAQELQNLRQSIYLVMQQTMPNHLSFATLVASIDGKPMDDLSDDGLRKVVEILSDVPINDVTAQSEAVKKKIDEELTLYFPDTFDSSLEKEYYDLMKKRTMVTLQAVVDDTEEKQQEIDRLTDKLVTFTKPRNFVGKDSSEIEYDKQYEDMCLLMSQHLHTNPKKFTVLEYYNAYAYIKKSMKQQQKRGKKPV